MKRIHSVGICLASVLVGGLSAGLPTASAADDSGWVRPSHAPLVDAAGNESGCVANAPKMYVRQNSQGQWLLGRANTMLCDRQYGQEVWNIGLFEILPDGTRVTVTPMHESLRGGPTAVGVLETLRTSQPCSNFPGTHTFLTRAKLKVKVDKDSTNPYSAIVEKVTTVTCPS
jgi:hypothetical protein